MHGTGLFITLSTLSGGGTVVLIDEMGLDPVRIWDEVDAPRGRGAHDRRRRVRPPAARRARRRARPLVPRVAARDHVERRHLEPRGEARPARPPPRRHAARLARRVRGADVAARPPAPATPTSRRRASRSTTACGCSPTTAARSRPGSDEIGMVGGRRAHPARLLQGPREDREHVPHRRRRALLDPRRLRDRRRRRHDPAARARLGHREHRRREGVPRGGRARAARAPGDRRLRGRRRPRRALRRDGGGDGGHPRRPSTRPSCGPTARTGASPGTRSRGAS